MNSLFPRPSLRRSPRTRTRKNSISVNMDTDYAHSLALNSALVRQKTRPPPLQIIEELSENEQNFDLHSPATARPFHFAPQHASCITLSAYTFSIDDALLMFGYDAPRSPALSASSSTTDSASSEDVPTTPRISDSEDEHDFILATPRLRPQRVSVRPLCIMKTRSLICQEDEDIHNCLESYDKEDGVTLSVTEEQPKHITQFQMALAQESEQDFYVREFEDFITFSTVVPFVSAPARRDSLTLVVETLPTVTNPRPKPRGRSRHSKPLPLLPPVTPPTSSFPSIPTFPLVQTTAQNSVIRRRRNVPSLSYPPPPLPTESRPLPRMSVPLDIDESLFPEENFSGPIVTRSVYDAEEDTSISSQPSFAYTASASTPHFQSALLETPVSAVYSEVILPRSSTDSDAPRSSIDSNSSFASSTSSFNRSASPFSSPSLPFCEDDDLESTQRLRSRWSSSTLGSLALEPSRTTTFFSPIKSVLHARTRSAAPPAQKAPRKMPAFITPPRLPKNKYGSSSAPSLPSTQSRHIRQQGSRSSTSSSANSSVEPYISDGSPVGLKRKPMLKFLRSS